MFKLTEPVGGKDGIWILGLLIQMPVLLPHSKPPASHSLREIRYPASKNTYREPIFTKMSELQARSGDEALRSHSALWEPKH